MFFLRVFWFFFFFFGVCIFFWGGCLSGFWAVSLFFFVFVFGNGVGFFASFFWRGCLGGFFVLFLFFLRRGFGRLFFALFSEALFKRKRGWYGRVRVRSFLWYLFLFIFRFSWILWIARFFFSLPFLYLPFLSGVNAISCHDANRVFSFLIVSHDDILQTYVRMQGSRNQDVPTPYLPTLCFWLSFCAYVRFLLLLTLCIHPPSPRPHLTPSFTFWFWFTRLFFLLHIELSFLFFLPLRDLLTCMRLCSCFYDPPESAFPSLPFLQYSFLSFFFVPRVD